MATVGADQKRLNMDSKTIYHYRFQKSVALLRIFPRENRKVRLTGSGSGGATKLPVPEL